MADEERRQNDEQGVNGASGGAQKKRSPEARLEDLHERLYSRGNPPAYRERRKLRRHEQEAKESWERNSRAAATVGSHEKGEVREEIKREASKPTDSPLSAPQQSTPPIGAKDKSANTADMPKKKSKRQHIRTKLMIGGAVFFAAALILSIAFLLLGQNTISGDNITIGVKGPFVVGGGEEMDLQIAISNQNAVPIEAATLLVDYPHGTQSATDAGQELSRIRRPLESIQAGEVLNIPLRAVVFGEENEEKEVRISVEYRVAGSNATFFKDAEPYRFKVSSSPVVLTIDALEEITSGQEAELDVTVTSNSPSPVTGILIEAEYPAGFEYLESNRDPVSGSNIWRIDSLEPEGSETITIRGAMTGDELSERVFTFRVGVPNDRDAFDLASVFSVERHEMTFERGFLGLEVETNGSMNETTALARDDRVNGRITFTNTLSNTIYDGEIEVTLSGSALDERSVRAMDGRYDSNTNTLTWDSSELSALREITPGSESSVSFSVEAVEDDIRTPVIEFDVSVRGKRVSEDRVPEALTDSVSRTVRFESEVDLESYAVYSIGPFTNTGPIQPVAEELTQYTFVWEVENGSNDVADATVSARLPSFITWLDLVSEGDIIEFNAETREVTWDVGDLDARGRADAAFQVSFLPSKTQIGTLPTILEEARFRATDRFTGTLLRENDSAVTTRLSRDPDPDAQTGRVLESGANDDEDDD